MSHSQRAADRRAYWIGFGLGLFPGLAVLIFKGQGTVGIPLLLFTVFAEPVIASVLCVVPRTRKCGLGMLIGMGISWLGLLTFCTGSVFASPPSR
jgi:hypothetical protein